MQEHQLLLEVSFVVAVTLSRYIQSGSEGIEVCLQGHARLC